MNKWIFLSGAVAVALGAFGAHALRPLLTEKLQHTFETAIHYHFYHTLALMFVLLFERRNASVILRASKMFFFVGIFLFSGSLYTMVFMNVAAISGSHFAGMITPLGGLSFIIGWSLLFYYFLMQKKVQAD